MPDLVVAKPGDYDTEHPTPEDILLLIEVSSTTLKTDLGVKLEKYAEKVEKANAAIGAMAGKSENVV